MPLAGGAAGAAVLGALIFRRRRAAAQSLLANADDLNTGAAMNPLYSGAQVQENPLFNSWYESNGQASTA